MKNGIICHPFKQFDCVADPKCSGKAFGSTLRGIVHVVMFLVKMLIQRKDTFFWQTVRIFV